ncbi:MAG: hypothetical protein V4805_12645 [Pseudomonadota bacterium]
MKKQNFSIRILLSATFAQAFLVSSAYALPTQTWVSGFGADTGTCTFAAPCKTFAYALNQTAAGGEISIDSPGEFGVVTINKSITINAVGALGSIVVPAGINGITIAAGATDAVVLRGLTLNGAGLAANGIIFTSGARLDIENTTLTGFATNGVAFLPTATSGLYINNVSVKNSGPAVTVIPTGVGIAKGSINGLKSQGNHRGVAVYDNSIVTVRNSIVSGKEVPGGCGFCAATIAVPPVNANLTVESSVASGFIASTNQGGIQANGSAATVRISNVTSTGNTNGIALINGGQVISFGNNHISGNINPETPPSLILSPGQI